MTNLRDTRVDREMWLTEYVVFVCISPLRQSILYPRTYPKQPSTIKAHHILSSEYTGFAY